MKEKHLARLEAHYALDHIVQGKAIWTGEVGTAVGCTIESDDYALYPTTLGLPEWFAWAEDAVFEGLPSKECAIFAIHVLQAIPVGANIEPVRWKLAIARHNAQMAMLQSNEAKYAAACRDAIQRVVKHCEQMLSGYETEAAEKEAIADAERSAKAAEAQARKVYKEQNSIESAAPWLADAVKHNPRTEARLAKEAARSAADAMASAARSIESPRSAGKSIKAAASAARTGVEKYFQDEGARLIALVSEQDR
ncbi:hypothetical protein WMF30_21160 [Sorangium sp. So ce134]